MQDKKQQLELNMEPQTGSKSGKEYIKPVCCHPAYLIYMQNTSHEMPGLMKGRLESKLLGEISITSDMQQRRQWHPTPVLLPGNSHGQRSLVGGSPWGHKESDTPEQLHFHFSLFTFMHWRRKWQPTPVFLPGESQGQGSLVGCRLWGHTESDMTEAT